jgi:hypothetical protein
MGGCDLRLPDERCKRRATKELEPVITTRGAMRDTVTGFRGLAASAALMMMRRQLYVGHARQNLGHID